MQAQGTKMDGGYMGKEKVAGKGNLFMTMGKVLLVMYILTYLNVMKNPYVNIIGHPDDSYYPVDYRALVEGAKEHHVLLEVNNGSLTPGGFRQNTKENSCKMLELCKEYKVPVIMDSDAHVDTAVGNHQYPLEVIQMVDFPEELVVNTNVELAKSFLNYFKSPEHL